MTDTTPEAPAVVLAPPLATDTKRDYLVRLGLAKPSRGRFGKEAVAALAAAEAQGYRFVEPVVAPAKPRVKAPAADKPATVTVGTPAPVAVPAAPVAGAPTFVAKDVRAWAKANNVAVGERGRIHPSVIDAFAKAGGKASTVTTASTGQVAKRPSPLDVPKRRPENTGFTVIGGTLIRQDACGKCNVGVARCACKTGPQAHAFLSREVGETVLLTLDKPAL